MATADEEYESGSPDDVTMEFPEESPELEIGADAEGETPDSEPFVYDEEQANLVSQFLAHPDGEKALLDIADEVIENYDTDFESSEEYRARKAEDLRIWAGELKQKDFPFRDCANGHVPIMLENVTRITTRMIGELFGNWQNVFAVTPVSADLEAKAEAEVMTIHGNWQIRRQIPDFKRQMDRMALMNILVGDFAVHSHFDEEEKCNRQDVLTPDEFVIPYTHVTTDPRYADVPHMTRVFLFYRHQLEQKRERWEQVDKVLKEEPPGHDEEPDMPLGRAASEVAGVEPLEGRTVSPYKVLWYEGWMQLPNMDRQRYVQVIVDYATRTVMKLAVHEEADWRDMERFKMQAAELEQFRSGREMWAMQKEQDSQELASIDAAVSEGGIGPAGAAESYAALEQRQGPAPLPPDWMKDPDDPEEQPEEPRKVPVRMFAHGVCLEPLAGSLGLGFGRIQGDYNRAANTVLNQFLDSATLANIWAMLVSGDLKMPETIEWGPGKVIPLPGVSPQDMANGIKELKPGPANPQLLEAVKLFQQFGQSSMQSNDVLSGASGKSGEPYRAIAARIEQATKQLGVITRKMADVLEIILENNAKLNARFLPEEELISVSDHLPLPVQIPIRRAMYERSYKIEIQADMRFATQAQRVAEADEMVVMAVQNPMLMHNPSFLWMATRKALEARGRYDMVPLLGEMPPPGMMPPPPPPGGPGAPPGGPPGPPGPSPGPGTEGPPPAMG